MPFHPTSNLDSPLLRTKITPPRIPPEFVHRPRLTERIDRGVKGPLTLLSAPAGYGKTNLLIEWVDSTQLPVAWLNIDSDDNDRSRFFRYLIAAFQTVEPHLGEEALYFLQSTPDNSQDIGGDFLTSGLKVGLTQLINEIAALPNEIVLILDDFQMLEGAPIRQSTNYFLKQLPQNLHVIISSRIEPAIDLAFLRAKGRVVELGTNDLRFTSEEVALFFQQMIGLQLPIDTVQAIEKRTEGWVTALQMAAISIRHQPDPNNILPNLAGDAHYLVDFLAEEVLDRQPEDVRQFLLRSSILDTLTGSLCEAVVNPDAQPGYGTVMLDRLEHARLFITALDEKHEWFSYHYLFADFLYHILAENYPAEIPELQKRAAIWFEKDGNLEKAFQYGLSSGDMEWSAELIQRNIETMIKTGEIFSLTRWIGHLPDMVIHLHPGLALAYAWRAIATYQLDLARFWLDDVRRALEQYGRHAGPELHIGEPETLPESENASHWNIYGGLAISQSILAMLDGDLEQAAEFSKQATRYLREDNPFVQSFLMLDDSLYFILSGDTQKAIDSLSDTIRTARQANNLLVMIIATCQLADMRVLQGQLDQAWATLQKAQYMTVGPDGKPLPLAGLVDIGFGEILLERGSLEEAHAYLERGCKIAQSQWSISSLDGMVSLARLHQAIGDPAGTQAIITDASQMAASTESSTWDDSLIAAIAIRLALQRDDLADAEQWWIRGGFPELTAALPLERYPYHIFEYLQLTQARFLLMRGRDTGSETDLRLALERIEPLSLGAERFHRVTSQIEILILQALIRFALGDEHAKDIFLQALALGEPAGYQQIYLDEGQRLSPLLRQCQTAQLDSGSYLPSADFLERLLGAIPSADVEPKQHQHIIQQPPDPATTITEDGFPISLSRREVEVLALIAEGKSNQEISAQLYLALNTVKRHAYNIYTKLGVKKRTQAVSMARKLKLIS